MSKEMIVSCNGREKKIAILDNGKVTEFYIERGEENSGVVGNVYKGRVMRVLPGMQSAFVDIGLERDAFLYVSDFFDEEEEIERIVMEKGKKTSVEEATREVNERIDRSRIEREKQMESVQELAEPLAEPNGDAETDIDAPAVETATAPQEEKPERGKRTRGGRGRKDRVEEPQAEAEGEAEAEPAPVFEIDYDNSGFERIADDDETGDMFKDAYMQEAIVDRVRAVEFDMESIASAEVGTLLAEVAGDAGGFERIADEEDEAPAKGKKAKSTTAKKPAAKAKAPAKKPAAKGKAAKGKKAKSDEPLEDAEASLKESDETAEMAVRRGGRGRRRGGKPKAKEAGDDSIEAVDGEESAEIVDTDAEQTEIVESVEEAPETESEPDAEPEIAPESSGAAEESSDEEKPRDERPEREGRSRGGRGRGGRGRGGKTTNDEQPADDQSAEKSDDEPRSDDRPSNDRPSRDRSQDRQSNDRPSRDRSQDRPSNDRPSGDRPSGDRPSGDRDRGGRGRGGRDRDRGPQPTISDLLKEGQEILVQIAKEPIAKKGARITSHIALPGRFLVYMPTIEHLGVSRKIESSSERSRLRGMLQRIRQDVAITTGGFIVRTAGIGISEEDLRNDAKFLVRTWADAKKDSEKRKSPAIVHQDLDLVQRLLRDQLSEDFTAIRVDSEEEYLRTVEFMNRMAPKMVNRVKLYTRDEPILEAFGVQEEIDKALKPRVWLKSGGYLVLNQTEALVAIDVNTGKFVGKGNARLEDTITRTNMEAVDEIARQIRLRDLGGIIVLDLIDMEDRRNRHKVSQALQEALSHDKSPTKVLSFNDFGLIIMTRKRVKQSLERTMCAPCEYCEGAGWVKSPVTICYEILSEARRLSKQVDDVRHTTIRVHPEVSKALRTTEREVLEEIEAHLGNVDVTADKHIHQAQFDFAFI
ncbi:MAG TPA: Rne/Rng family ribonuclease [Pyrinomonadaceae bacterium]|nr:Rne/Rng family ribonuclease [Pyrinomonadaceae bacterium]